MGSDVLVCSGSGDSVSWGGDGGDYIEGGSGESNRIIPYAFRGDGGVPGWVSDGYTG